jgi:hypothetical protein
MGCRPIQHPGCTIARRGQNVSNAQQLDDEGAAVRRVAGTA